MVSEGQCHTGTGSHTSGKLRRWICLTESRSASEMTPGALLVSGGKNHKLVGGTRGPQDTKRDWLGG